MCREEKIRMHNSEKLQVNTFASSKAFYLVSIWLLVLNSHDLPWQKVFALPDQDNRRPQEMVGLKEVEMRKRRMKSNSVILAESLWTVD